MDQSADQSHSTEEVKWSTTTTTKTFTTTSTSSAAETLQSEELANNLDQITELNQTLKIDNSLENTGGKEIKISIDNKSDSSQQKLQNTNTSSTSTMQSSTTTTTTEIREVAIAEHNKLRRRHGAPDLKPDAQMHDEAQRYAECLAKGNKDTFKTSKTDKYGENIATSSKRDKVEAITDAVTRMYDTVQFYDYHRPGYNVDNKPTGLFTSIVWKSSERIGVGCAWNQVEENYSIVFYYDPITNVTNEFKDNVLPSRT